MKLLVSFERKLYMKITIKKIAELANVSRGTVDRVLHDRPNVTPETKEKVLGIINELNYQPNLAAKALGRKSKPIMISVILAPDFNPFVGEIRKGVADAYNELKHFGLTLDVEVINALNADEQIKILNKLEKKGVDGIAIVPIDSQSVRDCINRLINKGIKVVTFNSDIYNTNRLCFVGQDNEKAGRVVCNLMENIVPPNSQIAVIISSLKLKCHQSRLTGFMFMLGRSEVLLNTVSIDENQDKDELSYAIVKEYCNKYPELKGIYITGGGVTGLAKALTEVGLARKIKVISHDLVEPVITQMKEGVITFSIGQNPYIQGSLPIKLLFNYIFKNEKPEQEIYNTGVDIKTYESL